MAKILKNAHEKFVDKLAKTSPYLTAIGKYISATDKVLVKDELGIIYNATPNNIYQCRKISIVSAVDKTDAFIRKAKYIHGDIYDYSKSIYVSSGTYITVICHEHGEFNILPENLFMGRKCPRCEREERAKSRKSGTKLTHEEFVKRVKEKHPKIKVLGDYSGATKKILIEDELEIKYLILPKSLLHDHPPTMSSAIDKTDAFIKRSKSVQKGIYDYSLVKYVNTKTPVDIICSKHGKFSQEPRNHLGGFGCNKCGEEATAVAVGDRSRDTHDEFVAKLKIKQPKIKVLGKYSTSYNRILVEDDNGYKYSVLPPNLIKGYVPTVQTAIDPTYIFVSKSKQVHDGKYDYSKTKYSKVSDNVIISCPIHGDFSQRPEVHLRGGGCPTCGKIRGFVPNTAKGWSEGGDVNSKSKSFKLYMIEVWNDDERFIKIGITYHTVARRYSSGSSLNGYNYKTIAVKERSDKAGGVIIFNLEDEIHNLYWGYNYYPITRFDGWTECYDMEVKNEILEEYFS